MSKVKLYTEEHLKIFYHLGKIDGFIGRQDDVDELIKNYPPIELPSDKVLMQHIDYLIICRQNLIDNADNMPQHLLEGGCMAFESAIDNARELFLGGNNEP